MKTCRPGRYRTLSIFMKQEPCYINMSCKEDQSPPWANLYAPLWWPPRVLNTSNNVVFQTLLLFDKHTQKVLITASMSVYLTAEGEKILPPLGRLSWIFILSILWIFYDQFVLLKWSYIPDKLTAMRIWKLR